MRKYPYMRRPLVIDDFAHTDTSWQIFPASSEGWTVGHCRKSTNGRYRNFEVFQKASEPSELGGKVIEARKKSLHLKGLSHEIDLTFNDMYN